jgi:hypothetical protein
MKPVESVGDREGHGSSGAVGLLRKNRRSGVWSSAGCPVVGERQMTLMFFGKSRERREDGKIEGWSCSGKDTEGRDVSQKKI